MHVSLRQSVAIAAALSLVGCATLPPERGYRETSELVRARIGTEPLWATEPGDAAIAIPNTEISPADAVRLALQHHPRVRQAYARLGIGRAELEEARRIGNPSLGFVRLGGGEASEITRSLSLGLTDVLMLPARKRLAEGELLQLQQEVAAELLDFATEVETAWYESVSAAQVAKMREVVAHAAEQSAELAQRFFDAGNINRLQLAQERAAASQARIAAVRAAAEAQTARAELAELIGLPIQAQWRTATQLAAPPTASYAAEQLVEQALQQRLDLAAAKQAVALREDALGVTRRWRWLGDVEIGYEREAAGAERRQGPSLSLGLPIFDQGQAAMARAEAELVAARAELDELVLDVHNAARIGLDRLAAFREIAEHYRTALVPQREAIVAHSQAQVNFMLMGVFELILAKQQEYDAYQEYLEAVRDYWIARAKLRRVVGGRLPDDDAMPQPSIGVEAILPAESAPAMDHSMHGHHHAAPAAADPHAAHRSPPASDPHAGHAMPKQQPTTPTTGSSKAAPAAKTEHEHAGHGRDDTQTHQHQHQHDDHRGDTP